METPPVWNGKIALNFAGGAGTSDYPYLISTGAELAFLAQQVNDDNFIYNAENVHYKLTADIVLNATTDWESWNDTIKPTNIWTPIGNVSKTFLGMFDGTGHTVSGIYLSDNLISQGLFGNVGDDTVKTATVENVGVINSFIKGNYFIGGVVGTNYGKVINCYNTGAVSGAQVIGGVVGKNLGGVTDCYNKGSVSGSDQIIGGVVAQNWGGAVLNCYNTGVVTGNTYVGGVVGHNNTDKGTVVNCYSSGNVTGNKKGGVIGLNSGKVANCYFLEAGGLNTVGEDTGTVTNCSPFDTSSSKQLTTEGKTERTPENKAWVTFRAYEGLLRVLNNAVENYNVDAAVDVAAWLEGADGNPRHKVMPITPAAGFAGGNGSKETPYLIGTPGELAYLAQQVNTVNDYSKGKFFKLTAHIELNDTAKWTEWGTTTPGKSWTPIGGYNSQAFQGVFDGAGYTVSGIYTEGSVYQALFGIINTAATVMNVGVIESYIKGDDNIGGIVGCIFSGTVLNCYNSGAVSGEGYVGGIVGQNQGGTVVNCYSTGVVTGTTNVGGVVGNNRSAVANCYFLKITDGVNKTLDVAGSNTGAGKVTNCSPFDAAQDFATAGLADPSEENKALTWFPKEAGLPLTLNAGAETYNAKSPAPAVRASAWETIKRNYPTFVTSLPLPEIALSSTSKPYNGAAQEPTVTVGSLVPTTDYTLSWEYAVDGTHFIAESGTPAFKNAGTYRVTAIGAEGDYKGSKATADYVITPIGVTLAWAAPADLVYNKTAKTPSAVVVQSDLITGDTCAVKTKAATSGNNNTDVGSFTFTATELDNTNYVINTKAVSDPYIITARPLTNIKVSKEADTNVDFNAITLISGTSGKNCEGLANGDEVTITFATSSAVIGVYTGDTGFAGAITLGGASANNYSVAKADVTATITGKPIPAFSVMAPSAYDKTAHSPTVTITGLTLGTHYTLKWSYAADNVNFIDVEGTPEFINAGIYLVTATGVAGSDYEGSTQTGDYSINPIVVTLTWQPEKTFSYTGSPIVPTVVAGGMLEGDECAVTAGVTPGMDGTNAKSTPITFTATKLSNTNYTLPTDPANRVSGSYTITIAENVWTTGTAENPIIMDSIIYVGETPSPKAEAKFGTVEFVYAKVPGEGAGEDVTPSSEPPTEIGFYIVNASVDESENYHGLNANKTFEIKQRPSDDDSGSGSAIPPEDFFWTGVVSDLKLKTESVVSFNCQYPRMSRRVLLALQEVDKTLNINLNGEKLAITSKQVKPFTFDKASYSVAELKALIEVKPEITPTPTPTPTEKPTEPTEPTAKKCWLCGACPMFLGICLWIWLAIAVVAVAVVVFIVVKKKKKNDKK